MLPIYQTVTDGRAIQYDTADQESSAFRLSEIAEGASRKSVAERKRYYEVARGSIIEIDAALDVSNELKYCNKENLQLLGSLMQRTFSMLSKMLG